MEPYVSRLLAQYDLIPRGARVLTALSGGRDSVCLLHKLISLREEYGWEIMAAHLDHGLREDSAADAEFVRQLCRRWGVPCVMERRDVAALKNAEKLSVEDAARRVRYQFLEETAKNCGADRVALAHHALDQAETVLLHLSRGSGLAGASGMRPRRGIFVRPMLWVPTREVQAYFDRHGLTCVQDSTNFDLKNPRNAIRYEILPRLEALFPAAESAFARAGSNLQQDEDALSDMARRCLCEIRKEADGVSARVTDSPYPSITHRALMQLCREAGLDRDLDREAVVKLARMLADGQGRADLPHGFTAWVYRGRIWIGKVNGTDRNVCDRWILHKRICECEPRDFSGSDLYGHYFGKLPENMTLRTKRAGDRLCAPGMKKSLGDYFTDQHIPPWLRDEWPLLTVGSRIIWIPGTAYADPEFHVTDSCPEVYYLRIEEKSHDDSNG